MKDALTTRDFWTAAGLRAVRSFAQGILTLIGADVARLFSIQWYEILITATGLAVVSLLTSIVTGLPEAATTTSPVTPLD
jgi:Putative lactococcus lactis phage r1t holin